MTELSIEIDLNPRPRTWRERMGRQLHLLAHRIDGVQFLRMDVTATGVPADLSDLSDDWPAAFRAGLDLTARILLEEIDRRLVDRAFQARHPELVDRGRAEGAR